MKTLKTIVAACLLLITVGVTAQNDKDKKIMKDAEKAKTTLMAKDAGLDKFFQNSSGYAIFPNVGKGGLIIGGASGNGVLYENGIATGMASLKKINIGLQAGGQAVIQVVFFETDDALAKFKEGNYEFSAEASAVIADKGASEDANYNDGVIVFALPKAGLMADASIGGQKFEYDAFK
ncbi:Lipid-binding SYLF domain-containing protein [Flaviramulus basaltis]|uniref:Lipid-binding SYLF domain-containing protein n=1 Tax=Flaviramulus basaltis TaxID=369401 RepID=A0A1K2IJD4_9FLAO|nr:lipid-binding SYLF domain-containing protein [Flaviramulus basaltis]SFZ92336.1 Lipid-binding SYLF domain-containing protein [Flaviramulus basaltis]